MSVSRSLDHSSARSLSVKDIDLTIIWNRGLKFAQDTLEDLGYSSDELNIDLIENPRITVINSKGDLNDNFLDDEEISDEFIFEDTQNVESQDFINTFDEIDGQLSDDAHSATVTNMGLVYNKANVINSIINCKTKISTDRNIRVRSLNDSNYELNETLIQSFNNDESIIATDTLVTILKSKSNYISLFLVSIEKFSLNGQNLFEINHDMLDNCKIEATLLCLDKCTIDDKNLNWPGSYVKSSKLNLSGMYCSPIKIKYESTSSCENGIYSENKLVLIPIDNLLQIRDHFSLLIKDLNSCNDIPVVSYSYPSKLLFVSNWKQIEIFRSTINLYAFIVKKRNTNATKKNYDIILQSTF